MITALIIGLGAMAVTATVIQHWDQVVVWLKDFVSNLKDIFVTVGKAIAHAAAVFAKVMAEGIAAIMHKIWYKENGQYVERVTTRTVPENEVPNWVKAKISAQEQNMSKEFENHLSLKL